MAINYIWGFSNIKSAPDFENLPNVILSVNWSLTAQDGPLIASMSGISVFDPPTSQDFIPFDQVDPSIMEQWVTSTIGADQVQTYKDLLAAKIYAQRNPINTALPPAFKIG